MRRIDVAGGIGLKVAPAFHQTRHRGQVNDDFAPVQDGRQIRRAEIDRIELKAVMQFCIRNISLFDLRGVVGNERVHANDFAIARQQGLAQVRSDESCSACDKYSTHIRPRAAFVDGGRWVAAFVIVAL